MANWVRLAMVVAVVAAALLTLPGGSESKRPGRKRLPGLKRFANKRARQRSASTGESRKVYYYSMPGDLSPSRVILGEELNFSNLIKTPKQLNLSSNSNNSQDTPQQAANNYESHAPLFDPYDEHDSLFHTEQDLLGPQHAPPRGPPRGRRRPPRGRRQRGRGPGYRRRPNTHNWEEHYVLNHFDQHHPQQQQQPQLGKKKPPKVMDSMKRAAGELKNAYKAALIQSAKMAQFTGSAAASYFKGVRNLMGGSSSDREYRKQDKPGKPNNNGMIDIDVLRIPEDMDRMKDSGVIQEVDSMDGNEVMENSQSGNPNVYLDWGGSFWRLFYNQRENGHI